MYRLTEQTNYPLDTFSRCQLCGKEGDICSFYMWEECDDADQPEPGNVLVICRDGPCNQQLQDHERLYHQVPWGQGGPGHFMLLCGSCENRDGTKCTHPKLKANGGDGLLVNFANLLRGIVCFNDGQSRPIFPSPATKCEGYVGPDADRATNLTPEENK